MVPRTHSRLTVFLTKGKRVFHVLIFSLVHLGNGYASGRHSYIQAFAYSPCHTYCVTILVFVCPYVRTTLSDFYLFYVHSNLSAPHICKLIFSAKFSKLSHWNSWWHNSIFELCHEPNSCLVNGLTVLYLFIVGVFPIMQISTLIYPESSWICEQYFMGA